MGFKNDGIFSKNLFELKKFSSLLNHGGNFSKNFDGLNKLSSLLEEDMDSEEPIMEIISNITCSFVLYEQAHENSY